MNGMARIVLLAAGGMAGACLVPAVRAGHCGGCPAPATGPDCPAGVCAAKPMAETPAATARVGLINTEALAAMLRQKVPMVVLDARSGKWDDGRRVPGAKALSPTAKDEEIAALLPDKAALIVAYCTNPKCPASAQLAKRLRGLGYTNVLEYHEGIEGWAAAGERVEQVTK
jgi:rhodanese-related sulfurtransferase